MPDAAKSCAEEPRSATMCHEYFLVIADQALWSFSRCVRLCMAQQFQCIITSDRGLQQIDLMLLIQGLAQLWRKQRLGWRTVQSLLLWPKSSPDCAVSVPVAQSMPDSHRSCLIPPAKALLALVLTVIFPGLPPADAGG